jgi:hypothetical protein
MAEYALRFRIRASSAWAGIGEQYRSIPRSVAFRLKGSSGRIAPPADPSYYQKQGYYQEVLVFEEERTVDLTLQSPANGICVLQICLSEAAGVIEISDLEIRPGCADVLYREFENGLVILNGSARDSVVFSLSGVLPGKNYRRIRGKQDPDHNNGQFTGDSLTIRPRDAFFLVEEPAGTGENPFFSKGPEVRYTGDPGRLILQFADDISGAGYTRLSVYDILGRKQDIRFDRSGPTAELDISGLPGGIYLLVIESGQRFFVQKIINYV